ncbi:hypothetical protein [Streptomyces sp. NPDC055210]
MTDRRAGQRSVRRQPFHQHAQEPQRDAALEERPQRAAVPVLRVLVAQVSLDGLGMGSEDV